MVSDDPIVNGFLIAILCFFVICACSIVWQIRVCRRRRGVDRMEAQSIQRRIDQAVQQHHMQQEIIRQHKINKQIQQQQQEQQEQEEKSGQSNPNPNPHTSISSSPRHRYPISPSPRSTGQSTRNKILHAVTAAAANMGIRGASGGIHQPIDSGGGSGSLSGNKNFFRRSSGPPSPSSNSVSYSTQSGEQIELVTHTLDDGELEDQINLEEAEAEAEADAQMQAEMEAEFDAQHHGGNIHQTTNQPVYASATGGRNGGYRPAPSTSPKIRREDDEEEENEDEQAR